MLILRQHEVHDIQLQMQHGECWGRKSEAGCIVLKSREINRIPPYFTFTVLVTVDRCCERGLFFAFYSIAIPHYVVFKLYFILYLHD